MKSALVLGGAASLWDDLSAARKLLTPDAVAVVNKTGIIYPHDIDYWCSYHPDQLEVWIDQRRKNKLPDAKQLWIGSQNRYGDRIGAKLLPQMGGSSGLLAVNVLLQEGFTHIVLAGVPMDPGQGHFDGRNGGKPWKDGIRLQKQWVLDKARLLSKVKSMSGWTAELLGTPTREWLQE